MRTARFLAVVSLVILGLALPGMGKTARNPASYSEKVRLFLDSTTAPVLFVGKIVWVNSGPMPCRVGGSRSTTWSVNKVLYGFDPGKKIDVLFWSCGVVEDQLKSQDEMLVIVCPGHRNAWMGMTESIVPATDANIRAARKTMDDYLRRKVHQLVRPGRGTPVRPILVFEGALPNLGPKREPGPCVSTVQASFTVAFEVGKILRGNWTERQVTVEFTGCGPLPDPPYRSGQRVLVFALRMEPEPPTFFRAGFLLPIEQEPELMAALAAVEAGNRAGNRDESKTLGGKIRDFVRTARDEHVSILVFAGSLVGPVPYFPPGHICVVKEMPSFGLQFQVEHVLLGDSMERATIRFDGCELPPGSNYESGDHLLVFADVRNGGEFVGRLLAPADQIAEAKTALDAALGK